MKYYIDYTDKSGDLCHVWVYAQSESEAEYKVRSEYWDIRDIIQIIKA